MSKTKSALKRYSLLREYKVISDFEVEIGTVKHKFDKLLVGEFGVLNIVAFNKKGDLYGNENDANFVLIDKKMNREPCQNLIKEAQDGETVLRKIFAEQKVYNVKIDIAVVIENSYCQCMVSSQKVNILTLQQFKKYLNGGKFDLDNKADSQKIIDAISKYKV